MARRPYAWPSSRIDHALMHRLHLHQLRSGQRITAAVREAVLEYLARQEWREARVGDGEGER